MGDKNSEREDFHLREKEVNESNLRNTTRRNENLRFLLFIIEATLTVAAMAFVIFSPFIVYCFLLILSFYASEIAFIIFMGYLAILIFLVALIDYVRHKGKK